MEKFESERNPLFSVILGHTLNVILGLVPRIHTEHLSNVILGFIPRIHTKHLANVILGFIPRIHAKHSSLDTRDTPEYDKDLMVDTRVKPENNHKGSLIKGLDVVCQCAALLERRVQSSTRVRKAQAVTRQTNECIETAESGVDKVVSSCEKNPNTLLENLDSVRECAGIFKRRVQKEYTSAKISSRHQLNEFSLGRSMIEMLGVLAIIGVLSVGGIAGYTKAMEKIHVNKIVNMISDISATIKTAYISQKEYDNFDSGLYGDDDEWYKIQDMGLLPPEYTFEFEGEKKIGLSSPLTLINPFGISLEGTNNAFSTLSIGVLVPQNLCVPLLTYDWRNADMKGIVITLVNLTTLGAWGGFFYAGLDIDEEDNGNCNESSNSDYCCIELGKQRFKPVSPAVATKYCESNATDIFGTGQMYVSFDLLADIKVPRKD